MGRTATKIYCPHCDEIHPCWSVSFSVIGETSGRRFYRLDHNDINWFRRARECENCSEVFTTAEINEAFLEELVSLRDALKDIKSNAQEYQEDAKKASKTLDKLSESLKILKTLS